MIPPIQNAEKLPAVRPLRMLSDAPPSRLVLTTSRTCREWTDVKNVVSSGISAPASVPHEMIDASFHHSVPVPKSRIITHDARNVIAIEMIDVSQTRFVSGFSKSISFACSYFLRL